MRFILAPIGTEGDIRPIIALGCALRQSGNEILLATSANFEQMSVSNGIPFFPLNIDIKKLMNIKAIKKGGTLSIVLELKHIFEEITETHIHGLLDCSNRADCIIGSGLCFSGASVAEKLSIPYRHVSHVPQLFPSAFHPPATVKKQDFPPVVNKVLWKLSTFGLTKILQPILNKNRKRIGLAPLNSIEFLLTKNCIFAMDSELGPIPRDVSGDVISTGYWPLLENEHLSDRVIRFCERAPTIYVGFGSMIIQSAEQTLQLLADACKTNKIQMIVSAGWSGLGQLEQINDSICVIKRAPHHLLFPRVTAAIHHGGAGTTWAAAHAGIPQCIIPHLLDQFYWNKRVATLGLGPCGTYSQKLIPKTLGILIKDLVSNSSYKVSAQLFSANLKKRDGLKEAIGIFSKPFSNTVYA